MAAGATLLLSAPGVSADDRMLLERHRPYVRYDHAERLRATAVERMVPEPDRLQPGDRVTTPRNRRGGPDLVYGRVTRPWLQYWLFYVDNPQDRGIVRTGRHAGDWEMVQVRLDKANRPQRVAAAQHSWAESCGWSDVRHRGPAPVIFPANASHATYLQPGDVDRPIGDPTDEAGGHGRVVRPRLRVITATSPRWMTWPGRWGQSRAGWAPAEQSSPRGPAFQGLSWDDPEAFDRAARTCGSGPPPRTWATALAAGAFGVLMAALFLGIRRTRIARR